MMSVLGVAAQELIQAFWGLAWAGCSVEVLEAEAVLKDRLSVAVAVLVAVLVARLSAEAQAPVVLAEGLVAVVAVVAGASKKR